MKQTVLWRFIKTRDELLAGKLLELHALVTEWLSYIPATFPHYTRHTVAHSEQIIDQVSRLLFADEDEASPVLDRLSAMEAYIICVSALLHDSGMVVSEEEKARIIKTNEWHTWIESDGAAKHWGLIQSMRQEAEQKRDPSLHFKADILTRHLIAEFVRRAHHTRAAKLAFSAQTELARFAFDDPILLRTVADVCEAHGLPLSQLEDHSRFPDRRTVRGYEVNVRFITAALRLGDLLDMSHDRACPLVMGAACPLPIESIAHWTQYQRIQHRLTAPDQIELTAECESQDEHRYLLDWCSWIVDEVKATAPLTNKWKRHHGWALPTATIEGQNPTIVIRPSETAAYIPSEWSIQLDKTAVFTLLSGQLYESGLAFLRELIQNAVDATRCRLCSELESRGRDIPEFLIDVESHLRETMSVSVVLDSIKVKGEILGEETLHQVITVSDVGIGMTRSVIERFFLQVGRSYYKTEEFRRSFMFAPTSRFGVGFLSCFGVSDHVVVETKPYNSSEPPLKLVLTGPASYVLTEKSMKADSGTSISVRLTRPIAPDAIVNQIAEWFPALEFPIHVRANSSVHVINPILITPGDEMPVSGRKDAYFYIRKIPFRKEGLIGNLFVFVERSGHVERWDRYEWAHQTYRQHYPSETPPTLPRSIVSFHGAAVGDRIGRKNIFSEHVDMRGAQYQIAASRSHLYAQHQEHSYRTVLDSVWDSALSEHLDDAARKSWHDWRYLNKLFMQRGSAEFWSARKCVPIVINGIHRIESLRFIEQHEEIAVMGIPNKGLLRDFKKTKPISNRHFSIDTTYIDKDIYILLADGIKKLIMQGRSLARLEIVEGIELMSVWSRSHERQQLRVSGPYSFVLCKFPFPGLAAISILTDFSWIRGHVIAINSEHWLSTFINLIVEAVDRESSCLTDWHADHFFELLGPCVVYDAELKQFMEFSLRLADMEPSISDFSYMILAMKKNIFMNQYSELRDWLPQRLPANDDASSV